MSFLVAVNSLRFVCIHQCEQSPLHADFRLGHLIKSAVAMAMSCCQEGWVSPVVQAHPSQSTYGQQCTAVLLGRTSSVGGALALLTADEMQSDSVSRGEQFLCCQNVSIARAPYTVSYQVSCSTSVQHLSETRQTTKAQAGLYTSGNLIFLSSLNYSTYCWRPTKWGWFCLKPRWVWWHKRPFQKVQHLQLLIDKQCIL